MTSYLPAITIAAFTAWHGQAAAESADIRAAASQKVTSRAPVTPRQLTAEQRAELRRQLLQYSRPPGKHS